MTAPRNLRMTTILAVGIMGIVALVVILMVGRADAQVPSQLRISDSSGEEGSQISFKITLDKKITSDVSVMVNTSVGSGDTAKRKDFSANEEEITIAAGSSRATFTVETVDDDKVEGDETFSVNLRLPKGATIVRGRAQGTIIDNDTGIDLQGDYDSLTMVMEDRLAGCWVYESVDSSGNLTYVTNTDNAKCVPLRELTDETCLPSGHIYSADRAKFSVYWDDDGEPRLLGGLSNGLRFFDGKITLRVLSASKSSASRGVGLPEETVFVSHYPARDRLDFTIDSTETSHYNTDSQAFTDGIILDQDLYGPGVEFLLQRMRDIAAGNQYYIAADCQFSESSDLRDRLHQFKGESVGSLNAGNIAQSELDNGPDLDLFEVALTEGVNYQFSLAAKDPDQVNLAKVPFAIGTPSETQAIGWIQPTFRLLDSDGTELVGGEGQMSFSFVPATDGSYYVEVSHATEDDWYSAGVYTVSLQQLVEGDADIPGDSTTPVELSNEWRFPASIGSASDVDWFRLEAVSGTTYQILVAGDDSNGQTALSDAELTGYKRNGSAIESNEFRASTVNGTAVAELQASESGTYYIEVSSKQQQTGAYTARIQGDDHISLLDAPETSFGLETDGVGTIDGSWDIDRFELSVAGTMNYHIHLIPDAANVSQTSELSIAAADYPGETAEWGSLVHSDGSIYIQLVAGWFTQDPGPPSVDNTSIIIEVSSDGTSEDPAGYTLQVTSPQLSQVSAIDDFPSEVTAATPPEDYLTLDRHGQVRVTGELNGDGDVDAFGIQDWPAGEYIVDFHIRSVHGLIGMKVTLHKPDGSSEDISDNGFTVDEVFSTDSGYSISVSNYVDETTAPYDFYVTHTKDQ